MDTPGERLGVLDGFTGERIANFRTAESDTMVRVIGLAGDDTTVLLFDNQRVWSVDVETGETATLLDSEGAIPELVFDASTGTALASVEGGSAIGHFWLGPASGKVTELDLENLDQLPRPQHGWALLQTRDDIGVEYALLDMASGEIASQTFHVNSDAPSMSIFQTGTENGIWIVQGEPGKLLVFDGPGGLAFGLPLPEQDGTDWGAPAHGVSPSGECTIYTRLGSLFDDPPGISWIAPIEPDAEWTVAPFEISDWLEVPGG